MLEALCHPTSLVLIFVVLGGLVIGAARAARHFFGLSAYPRLEDMQMLADHRYIVLRIEQTGENP